MWLKVTFGAKPDTPISVAESSHAQALKQQFSLLAFVVAIMSVGLGCGSPVKWFLDSPHASANPKAESRKSSSVLDVGVLFANEGSYVCFPLEKLGIEAGREIVSITSSCECVRPSVVHYLQQSGVDGVAMRLDFIEDSKSRDKVDPIPLAVVITVQCASRAVQSVTIQFLHTTYGGKPS